MDLLGVSLLGDGRVHEGDLARVVRADGDRGGGGGRGVRVGIGLDDAALDGFNDRGALVRGDDREGGEPAAGEVRADGAEELNQRPDVVVWRKRRRRPRLG